jgi:hypothetical protein
MSLTSFIKVKQVREKFQETFVLPDFNYQTALLAPPLTKNYMLVGTAFDYLLRFYLKRLNPNAITKTWVAEQAVRQIPETFGWGTSYSIFGRSWYEKTYNKGLMILNEAKQFYAYYLQSGQVTKEIIKSAILLAQLDKIYREGRLDRNFGVVDDGDITDLENLIRLIKPEIFTTKNICLLNPTFGHASNLVGGADADLLVDDILVDIKTTKYLKFDRSMLHQLAGYYLLHKIGGIGDIPGNYEINKLSIYFSRHGELFTFNVKDLMAEDSISQFLNWFKDEAENCFGV